MPPAEGLDRRLRDALGTVGGPGPVDPDAARAMALRVGRRRHRRQLGIVTVGAVVLGCAGIALGLAGATRSVTSGTGTVRSPHRAHTAAPGAAWPTTTIGGTSTRFATAHASPASPAATAPSVRPPTTSNAAPVCVTVRVNGAQERCAGIVASIATTAPAASSASSGTTRQTASGAASTTTMPAPSSGAGGALRSSGRTHGAANAQVTASVSLDVGQVMTVVFPQGSCWTAPAVTGTTTSSTGSGTAVVHLVSSTTGNSGQQEQWRAAGEGQATITAEGATTCPRPGPPGTPDERWTLAVLVTG